MNAHLETLQKMGKKSPHHSAQFASRVFHRQLMEEVLPKPVFQNLQAVMEGGAKLDPAHADAIAEALKEWAMRQGATHYTHWFQPLNGGAAEKHDSFLSRSSKGTFIEHFRGQELLRGEPDASSFPSGNLRATHEARGYTAWDPKSPPFLWESAEGVTLCIPSLFFSWKGESLDHKIPLLRSEEKMQSAGSRLLKFCKVPARRIYSTLGAEQEYFTLDRSLFMRRPDLGLTGRTLFGARPAKGQELSDHYFGSVKERVLAFMRDYEEAAIRLGIPVKTRHSEVAPAQYEIAPLFEEASLAVDHNLLLMELMRQISTKHGLSCLFHEKPFASLNGSGKHLNWSLATDTGMNLLDPKGNRLVFLTLITAVLRGVHAHAALLRASIGSAGNDHRLGGHEAPPTILSVYLGEALGQLIERILHDREVEEEELRFIDLGLSHLPLHEADPADRNRTSFFAFTGNKFEFRAVGASAHCAPPLTTIQAIVADSLQLILDEMEDQVGDKVLSEQDLFKAVLPVLRKHLRAALPVLFNGNGYSAEWLQEAEHRGLPNISKSLSAFYQMIDRKSLSLFSGILSEGELQSRFEVLVEQYAKTMQIEARLLVELFQTHILPAVLKDQKNRADALLAIQQLHLRSDSQLHSLKELSKALEEAICAIEEVDKIQKQTFDLGWEAKAKVFAELAFPKMEQARTYIDALELMTDGALWPFPKYRELLFSI